MSFRQKWENYWYHYKLHTIVAVFLSALLFFGVKSCTQKELIDLHMVYMSTEYITTDCIDRIEAKFKDDGLVDDIDGDGANNFYMDTVVHSFDADSDMDMASMQKMQTILYAGQHTLMLAHQYALEDYDGSFEDLTFKAKDTDKVFKSPKEDFVTGISVEGNEYLENFGINTKNMYLAMRRRTNKEVEKNQNTEYFESAYKVMDHILSFNKANE